MNEFIVDLAYSVIDQLPDNVRPQIDIQIDYSIPSSQIASVKTMNEFESLPENVRVLTFEPDSCNEEEFTTLNLTRFVFLKEINIGEKALKRVIEFIATNLPHLIAINVGEGSMANIQTYV